MQLGNIPTQGGVDDYVQRLLGGVTGGARTSMQVSQSQVTSVSVNPTIVNTGGGSPNVSPSVNAPITSSPYTTGSAYATGDPPSYLNTTATRAVPGAMPGTVSVDPRTGQAIGTDWTMPALLGGAALLAYMLWD